ncbi:MAG: hypothetical protein ACD_19C00426G0096 [uncultured bacterium]|nr:MAG: hypothetical protein ACD_19C00426G0096 [uncultured bacterium]
MDEISWKKLLLSVKPISLSIAGLLSSAKPLSFEDNKIKLGIYYQFHKDKLEETKTKKMIEDIALNIFGKDIRIECCLEEAPAKVQLTDVANQNIISVAEQMFS